MKKLLLVLSFVALASLAFCAVEQYAISRSNAEQLTFAKHTLTGTYISTGFGTFAPEGDSPLDPVNTVTCPGTSGTCLLQSDVWVQAGRATDVDIAMCLYVDGSAVSAGCYYAGVVPDSYIQVSTSTNAPKLPVGTHTVQTHVFIGGTGGAQVGYYNINYKLYKP